MPTDIDRFADLIMNREPHELRVIRPQEPRPIVSSGVFAAAADLVAEARDFDGYSHCYIGLNPTSVEPHPIRRGEAVSDAQITRIRWSGIDIDGNDPDPVYGFLKLEHGFPEPLLAFSGCGWWLLYRIDQENTRETAELRRRFMAQLKEQFDDVDTSVYNASRVARLFGTVNLKQGAERSALVHVPDELLIVPDGLLEAVAGNGSPRSQPSSIRRASCYIEAALASACERVRAAAVGTRNVTLNREAHSVFRFVRSGELDARLACEALEDAATGSGLAHEEARRTLDSALRARLGLGAP